MRVRLNKLHAGQHAAAELMRDRKRVVIRCGRRWGKTLLLERTAAKLAYRGRRVGWFSPQYKLNVPTYRRLLRTLRPVVESASKIDASIRTVNGGAVEFWTLQDEDAGRSRFYDLAIIDEASLVKVGLRDIWEQSIGPTLLDRQGAAVMAGTPKGIDPDNYFYQACTDGSLGWIEYHAPTAANPMLDAGAVAKLVDEFPPLVYQQEYLAEFVDWRGTAFFSEDKLLDDGKPAVLPKRVDAVFAVVDSALKDSDEHDGTGVVYYAVDKLSGRRLYVLDWDLIAVESDLLVNWLPGVFARLEQLAGECQARRGSAGVYIEDKASGITLLQHAQRHDWPAQALDAELTAQGKDARAIAASGPVHRGEVKFTATAYDKVSAFHGVTRNHLLAQVCGFRLGERQPHALDLLDCFTYGVVTGLGT